MVKCELWRNRLQDREFQELTRALVLTLMWSGSTAMKPRRTNYTIWTIRSLTPWSIWKPRMSSIASRLSPWSTPRTLAGRGRLRKIAVWCQLSKIRILWWNKIRKFSARWPRSPTSTCPSPSQGAYRPNQRLSASRSGANIGTYSTEESIRWTKTSCGESLTRMTQGSLQNCPFSSKKLSREISETYHLSLEACLQPVDSAAKFLIRSSVQKVLISRLCMMSW